MKDNDKFLEVSISTTGGFFPADGYDRVKSGEAISEQLEKASKKLKITSTAGWVATVNEAGGKRALDTSRSYTDNDLSGRVETDWGPSEGGGGRGLTA